MRTAVRERAGMESNDPTNAFITNTELDTIINTSAAELHGLKVTTYEDYSLTRATSTVASGANTISLPTDSMKIRKLEWRVTTQTGDWLNVPQVSLQEIDRINLLRGRSAFGPGGWLLDETSIFIVPEAAADGTYRVWYAKKYAAMTSDSDTIDDSNGWHEYVIIDAAMKCLGKEESDVSLLAAQKLGLIARITTEAANRTAGGPHRVVDVRGDEDGYNGSFRRRGWR